MKEKVVSLEEAISEVKDGNSVGIGGASLVYKPMAAVREIVKQNIQNLTVYALMGDIDVDLLVGSGCASRICAAYVGFPMMGFAPNFRNKVQNGEISFKEYSELSFVLGLRAAAMGVNFLPTRSLLGSDLLKVNQDFKVFDCPITNQKTVAIPATRLDVALIHAYQSDSLGNVYSIESQIMTDLLIAFAQAAKKTIVTVEKVVKGKPEKDARLMLPHYEVDLIAETPYGAHPTGVLPLYTMDIAHITEYTMSSSNPETYKEYLKKYIYSIKNNEEYLSIAKKS
jgi:glutaconate CoA-transferase subunit A